LPKDLLRADDELPLQATIFRWTSLLNNPRHFEDMSKIEDESDEEGYPAVLPDGVRSRVRYIEGTDTNGALKPLYQTSVISSRFNDGTRSV
jgi:hypothetical protein